jgi:glutathione S-transferase
MTLADLLVAPHLGLFSLAPEWPALVAPHRIITWLARMEACPSFQATTWSRLEMAHAA